MAVIFSPGRPVAGYDGHGTIVIHYDMPSGIQDDRHENPGTVG